MEYVFVNDQSPDDSWEILRKTLADYPAAATSAKLIEHEKNSGAEAARATALRVAAGTYIWLVDSDDVVAPGAIQAILRTLEETDPDYLALQVRMLQPGETFDPKPPIFRHHRINERKLFRNILFQASLQHSAWANILRRKITEQHPMILTGLKTADDYVLHSYWSAFAESAVSLSPAVYGFVPRSQSITHTIGFRSWLTCVKRAYEILQQTLAKELAEAQRTQDLTAVKMASINLRMVFLCKLMNEFSPEERKPLLQEFDDFYRDYTMRDAFRFVPPVFIPIMLCDKLRCYRLMRLYTAFASAVRRKLEAFKQK